ncbi:MAG: hypothetical protein AAF988_03245 [Pseudomonadota bacterium]
MLGIVAGDSSQAVRESVNALWDRLGVDSENLASNFGSASGGEFNFNLDQAVLRKENSGLYQTRAGSVASSIEHRQEESQSPDNKASRFANSMHQTIATTDWLNKIVADINDQIDVIDVSIRQIDTRLEHIAVEKSDIVVDREQAVNEAETLETAIEEIVTTETAVERAQLDVMRADSADAVIAATERLQLTREEATAARDLYLGETATLEDLQNGLAELNAAIARFDLDLSELDAEELALLMERGDLVMDREQLIAMRDSLNDPEIRAQIEAGTLTRQDVLEMTMPAELQPSIMENLVTRFETGLDQVGNAVNGTVQSIRNVFARARDAVIGQEESIQTAEVQGQLTVERVQPAPVLGA